MGNSAPLNLEAVISRAPGVFSADLSGTLLVAACRGGQGHCMDPVGLAIWEYLAEPRSISNLCELLRAGYEVERTECEHDVMEFITDLLNKEMIVITGPNPSP